MLPQWVWIEFGGEGMFRGELVGLRAREDADVAILHSELHDDPAIWSLVSERPWRPVGAESGRSPYAVAEPTDDVDVFSVVTLADDALVGHALLWGIDLHNRQAHLGVALFAAAQGRGYGRDAVAVLCRYGFTARGLHRLQVETLATNAGMIATAQRLGFVHEGTLRGSAFVDGEFVDEVILGLLTEEWDQRS